MYIYRDFANLLVSVDELATIIDFSWFYWSSSFGEKNFLPFTPYREWLPICSKIQFFIILIQWYFFSFKNLHLHSKFTLILLNLLVFIQLFYVYSTTLY